MLTNTDKCYIMYRCHTLHEAEEIISIRYYENHYSLRHALFITQYIYYNYMMLHNRLGELPNGSCGFISTRIT